jgi:hypothetical protein
MRWEEREPWVKQNRSRIEKAGINYGFFQKEFGLERGKRIRRMWDYVTILVRNIEKGKQLTQLQLDLYNMLKTNYHGDEEEDMKEAIQENIDNELSEEELATVRLGPRKRNTMTKRRKR